MERLNYNRTRISCYFSYVAMSSAFGMPPLLLAAFHEMYGISYTLLGTLILVNFCMQLSIDLAFTFFSKYFNIKFTVRAMPILTSVGLAVYALIPLFSPQHAAAGLFIGTLIFSVAAGLSEVLVSPVVAAIPSEHPERDMSLLHSLYGWGIVGVVLISSLYLRIFGTENWNYLALFWAVLPLIASFLFWISPMPELNLASVEEHTQNKGVMRGLGLCVACIFLGSAAENSMTGWISGFMENALLMPKVVGDVLGMAVFAILLAIGRVLYAKFAWDISKTLLSGMIGAVFCYIIAGCSPFPIISFIACIMTGFCTSMLWPGTLILMEERFPAIGVAAYALMAAGGDFGAAVVPQLIGMLTDRVSESQWGIDLSNSLSLTPEQFGLRFSILFTAIFPIIGTFVVLRIRKKLPAKNH